MSTSRLRYWSAAALLAVTLLLLARGAHAQDSTASALPADTVPTAADNLYVEQGNGAAGAGCPGTPTSSPECNGEHISLGTLQTFVLSGLAFSEISGTLGAASGGSGVSDPTAHGVLLGEGASAFDAVTLASGKLLIGQSSGDPAAEALSGGATVSASGVVTLGDPGASTLGGVESVAAVSHEWITSISTGGVPALSQPAYADISGLGTAAESNTGTSGATVGLLNGNNTYSGNLTDSGSLAVTASELPTQAAGTLGLGGSPASPTLNANGEADLFAAVGGGITLIGQGSINDFTLRNSAGSNICVTPTGTQILDCSAFNGTLGATTPASAAVTTLTASSTLTLSAQSTAGLLVNSSAGVVSSVHAVTSATTPANFSAAKYLTVTIGATTYYLPADTAAW